MNLWRCHICGTSGPAKGPKDRYALDALAEHNESEGHLRASVDHYDLRAAEARADAEVYAKFGERARRKLGLQ